jgi:hypothetical protein
MSEKKLTASIPSGQGQKAPWAMACPRDNNSEVNIVTPYYQIGRLPIGLLPSSEVETSSEHCAGFVVEADQTAAQDVVSSDGT